MDSCECDPESNMDNDVSCSAPEPKKFKLDTELPPISDEGKKTDQQEDSTVSGSQDRNENDFQSSCLDNTEGKLPDPLNYTRQREFTSEIFKVQIHNLPKFGFSDLKKRLKSHLQLNPNKIKSPDRQSVAYVCFRSSEERDEALGKLNGHVWKGHTLEAKIAAPIADPYLQKRQQSKGGDSTHAVGDGGQMTPQEAEDRLRANVCPLWNIEYPEQLKQKTERVKAVLRKVAADNFVKWMFRNKKIQYDGLPCELLPIIPSPETKEYRNKNEFTIGYGLDGKTVTIGFRYGMYKEGTTAVGSCENLGIAMPAALPIVNSFTKFVAVSRWLPFQQQTGSGHWQTLTVRTFRTGDVMVMVDFVPRQLEQSEIEEAKASVKEFYTSGSGADVNIKSFYFRVLSGKGKSSASDVQLLFGEKHVYESLMNLKFRISPEAFFQVNTPATEKLYDIITEWCEASAETTVLDVCCGTGTIGLAMAQKVKEVIGIEMCAQAVEDAKVNAEINGVQNVTYYSSKVEDVIQNIAASIDSAQSVSQNVVAVVDPPRAGLHKDVIRTLRRCSSIQRLVYVSCNPESALTNFIDLIRPETSRHKGAPFTLVKGVPVDLFPGTKHCELVLLLTRGEPRSNTKDLETKEDGTEGQAIADEVSEDASCASNPGGTKSDNDNSKIPSAAVETSHSPNDRSVQSS